jgi:hypothetical protein
MPKNTGDQHAHFWSWNSVIVVLVCVRYLDFIYDCEDVSIVFLCCDISWTQVDASVSEKHTVSVFNPIDNTFL